MLLELRRDALELGIQRATQRIDNCDDRNRNAGGNEPVFDRGRRRLVPEERYKLRHVTSATFRTVDGGTLAVTR